MIPASYFLTGALIAAAAVNAVEPSLDKSLEATVAALDGQVFDAFNHCSDPRQLDAHARYFTEDIEFYHDSGGVTWNRDDMLANTRENVCGKFRRELVAGTLKVFPVKNFGAIAQGSHRFCQLDSGNCEGLADFTMTWREKNGAWQITRVLSYGHRAASKGRAEPKAAPAFDEALAGRLGADARGMRSYILVILKSGPKKMPDGDARKAMFAGHFANIERLAADGKLVMAGPFADSAVGWRGLFLLATTDLGEARRLTATDPVIVSGEMVAEYHPWYGSAAAMQIPEIHKVITPPDA